MTTTKTATLRSQKPSTANAISKKPSAKMAISATKKPSAKLATTTKFSKKPSAKMPAPSYVMRNGGKNLREEMFLDMYRATPGERYKIIKQGLPAHSIVDISSEMDIPRERFLQILNIALSTANRKLSEKAILSSEVTARLVGMEKLIGQVEDMVRQSGDHEQAVGFDAAKWTAHWIETPLPALGGDIPANYLDNDEGVTLVSNLLSRIQSGSYA